MTRRIVAVLDTYPALSETFLYTALQNMAQAGFDVSIRARYRGRSPHSPNFADVKFLPAESLPIPAKLFLTGLYALRLFFSSPPSLFQTLRFLRGLPGNIREKGLVAFRTLPLLCERADITYFSFGGLAVKYLEYMQLHLHTAFSLRGSDINIEPLLSNAYSERLKSAIQAARRVHCVCRDIQQKAAALSGEADGKFRIIHTAVNPLFLEEAPPPRPSALDGTLRLVSTGRLDWRKGFEHGLMAVQALTERRIRCSWKIVGDGEYKTALAWAVRDMGLEGYVFLEGGRSQGEVRDILCQSDIYFHPAVHEGLSNAVLEAMALGLPVVVSDVGGMNEVIQNGQNGFLIPPRDWKAMAAAMERLARDSNLCQRVGITASEFVRHHFTAERQQKDFLEFFGDCMDAILVPHG